MYRTIEAVWKDDHLEPLETIKTEKNVLRYLITIIQDESESQALMKTKKFGFSRLHEVLKNFTGSLSDTMIEERKHGY